MLRLFLFTFILLFSGISNAEEQEEQGHEYIPAFVGLWLKSHDFQDFEISDNTLTIPSKDLSVSGAIHEINKKENDSIVVETRLTVHFKGKQIVEEYVASFGDSPKEAFVNSIDNLCQTVFHPIFAKFIGSDDGQIVGQKITVGDAQTTFYYSGYGVTGDQGGAVASREIEELVMQELAAKKIGSGIHTAKLIVAQPPDESPRVTFTLNGKKIEELSEKFTNFKWPSTEDYHVGKLFIVLS